MTKPLILALDIGTSSVRSALYDHSGKVLPATMVKNERQLKTTADGGAEIDADEALDQVADAIESVLATSSKSRGELTHVAASSFWHSLVGVDANGRPTTKVLGWADTRSRKHVAKLRKRFDEAAVHNRTGARFHSSYWPAKLLWLRDAYPAQFAKTARWLSVSDYVALKLSGSAVTSVSMASGTGLFDVRRCEWDSDLLKFLKVATAQLPELSASDDTFRLSPAFSKRWPRLASAQWFPAIGDGAANNIGAGCLKRSRAAIMVGTSGAMRVAFEGDPPTKIPSGLWCYRIDRKRVIIGGALSDGGGLYRWLKQTLKLPAVDDKVEAQIAKRTPAAHGLTFLPFVAGERSTGYHENAAGAILDIMTTTDAIDIATAALESVAYRFAEIFDQLRSVCRVSEVIASGGALRESPVWTRMIADVLGRNLSLPDTREASSRGAVLLALETIGAVAGLNELNPPRGKRFGFSEARHSGYKQARMRHEELYRRIIED